MDAFYFETNGIVATIAMGKKNVEIVVTNRQERWTKVMRVESKKYKDAKAVWTELVARNGKTTWEVVKAYDFSNKPKKEKKNMKCCICGKTFTGWGHNPYPVKSEGECCSECNMQHVVPARFARLRMLEKYSK